MDHIHFLKIRNILLQNMDLVEEKLETKYRESLEKVYDLLNTGNPWPDCALSDKALNIFNEQLVIKQTRLKEEKQKEEDILRLKELTRPFFEEFYKNYVEKDLKKKDREIQQQSKKYIEGKIKALLHERSHTIDKLSQLTQATLQEIEKQYTKEESLRNRMTALYERMNAVEWYLDKMDKKMAANGLAIEPSEIK